MALFIVKRLLIHHLELSKITNFLFFLIFIKILVSINQYFNSLFFNFIQFNLRCFFDFESRYLN